MLKGYMVRERLGTPANGESNDDVTIVGIYVYLSVLFASYNIPNEWAIGS